MVNPVGMNGYHMGSWVGYDFMGAVAKSTHYDLPTSVLSTLIT